MTGADADCASFRNLMKITAKPIRVLAVDDHPLFREGIAALIQAEPDITLVEQARNGGEAIERFRSLQPDVTLMDLRLPDMSGIEVITAIRAEFPDARIIVLTTYTGHILAQRALSVGARAYLLKETAHVDLLEIIRAVHQGQKRINPLIASELAHHSTDAQLTVRELEVLTLIAAGNSNRNIAIQLSINEETVKGHVKSLLAKLRARDRTHAVSLALRRGIIQL